MAILYSRQVKMTALLEKIISIIAPHTCIVCSNEDNILCDACLPGAFLAPESACVLCEKPTVNWQICAKCRRRSALNSVYVVAEYDSVAAELLKRYKFERAKAAYAPLAKAMAMALPYIEPSSLVVPLPTAAVRVRQRGYDQSVLLARKLAGLCGLKPRLVLKRLSTARQVGANRKDRQAQAQTAYALMNAEKVQGKTIWLVDDICTTGASLNASATLMRKAGAKEVNAVVVAWQRLKS